MGSLRSRAWTGRLVVALGTAVVLNVVLGALGVEHDVTVVALLTVATVAAGVLTLAALEAAPSVRWSTRRRDAVPDSGEDTRTSVFRHLVEIHETSREADDTVLWQLADLASARLRQQHGLRYADDPARVTELLGPVLADLVARDRRQRYRPEERARRYPVRALSEMVRRIEEL